MLPEGTRIAFAGGLECNDHRTIWDTLDRARAKHPDMVLLHGGSPKGAERIAACWAEKRNVPQIVFKPDWTRHAKAAHDREAALRELRDASGALKAFSVQYHPEAAAGPHDAAYLFDRFTELMASRDTTSGNGSTSGEVA